MRSRVFLSSVLFGFATAKWSVIEKDLKTFIQKTNPDDRSIIGSNLGNLNGYGCWCYFDDKIGNGRGNPINFIDAECKILHGGYECIVADHAAQFNQVCEPWTIAYFSAAFHYANNQPISMPDACVFVNRQGGGIGLNDIGQCAADACTVEMRFNLALAGMQNTILTSLNQFSHQFGFDPTAKCPTYDGIHDPSKECCGTIPNRFPYKTIPNSQGVAQRGCCGEDTFHANTHKCCSGNRIRPKGFTPC